MSITPLISVVIPAYNHEKYVERCLDSVLEDPYPNKEIIIIDDGSTDKTFERIEAWTARNRDMINVTVRSRPNRGTAATCNEAWRLAKGEYIASIASDDYFLPGGFSPRVEYLENHPDLLGVFGDCIMVDDHGNLLHQSTIRDFHHTSTTEYATPKDVSFRIVWRWGLPGPILLARRSMLDEVGWYDESRRIEDWDMFLKLAVRDGLGFLDISVAAYRWHQTNTCRSAQQQAMILRELSMTAFKRAPDFKRPLLAGVVFSKGIYYAIKSIIRSAQNKWALSK